MFTHSFSKQITNKKFQVEKCKARALKLKQKKLQDDKEEEIRQQKQAEKEKMLTAKPAESVTQKK